MFHLKALALYSKGNRLATFKCQDFKDLIVALPKVPCLFCDQGNALFKQGNFKAAVVCYTAGMEVDPTNAILPANRAMAFLKLKRYKSL